MSLILCEPQAAEAATEIGSDNDRPDGIAAGVILWPIAILIACFALWVVM